MGKNARSRLVLGLAIVPFAAGALAAALVCGPDLAPPKKDDAGPPVSPAEHGPAKTQEVTYEPWELVST